jgi:hypothetical protein
MEVRTEIPSMRLNLHGFAVDLRCGLPGLRQVLNDLLGSLRETDWPANTSVVEGIIEPYNADVVARHLSSSATRLAQFGDQAELWADGERRFLIDESWGVCEINLLKHTFRSWLLPHTANEPMQAIERSVLWPLSQVMMTRDLGLIPAASVVHRGRGILLVSPFNIEPELSLLASAGHGLIGPRWTALREDDKRILLLQMPGKLERSPIPQLRSRLKLAPATPAIPDWIDPATLGATLCSYAWCDVVMLIEPGRRGVATSRALTGASAVAALKRGWPMPDVLPSARHAHLAHKLAQSSMLLHVELSRDPRDLLRMIENVPVDVVRKAPIRPTINLRATMLPRPGTSGALAS